MVCGIMPQAVFKFKTFFTWDGFVRLKRLYHRIFKQIFNFTSKYTGQLIQDLRLCFVNAVAALLVHLNIAEVYAGAFSKLCLG